MLRHITNFTCRRSLSCHHCLQWTCLLLPYQPTCSWMQVGPKAHIAQPLLKHTRLGDKQSGSQVHQTATTHCSAHTCATVSSKLLAISETLADLGRARMPHVAQPLRQLRALHCLTPHRHNHRLLPNITPAGTAVQALWSRNNSITAATRSCHSKLFCYCLKHGERTH